MHGSADCALRYLGDGVRAEALFEPRDGALPDGFDYYVATTRHAFDRSFPDSPVVHRIGRQGAVFTVIRGR